MAVSTGAMLRNFHQSATSMGAKAINSDFTIVIDGHEDAYLLCKQAPWAELSPQGEIEIALPNGSKMNQPQQVLTAQQGQIAIYETIAGAADNLLLALVNSSGKYTGGHGTFDCWVYEGTPEKYLRAKRYEDCFCQMDPLDRDWENRSQPLMWNGTMFYHYFGEVKEGNSTDYR
ncbi:hypothetical protein [uncultured Parasutterella sp.]|uniref:hypothetical protein n=1 Tax=uncultured Parasutterella sp. TaxID=1263098 RepID=UPI0025965114|nr:hypothetical protein [uncultured Parasutterella sp.]